MPLPLRQRTLVATLALLVGGGWLGWHLCHPSPDPTSDAALVAQSNAAHAIPPAQAPDVEDDQSEAVRPTEERAAVLDAGASTPTRPRTEEAFWDELTRLRAVDKSQALKYALLGEQWYNGEGRPAEARGAMIISLLVDLDRMEEARTRTRAFIAAYPNSSYRIMVQGVTGIHPRPGAPAPYQ